MSFFWEKYKSSYKSKESPLVHVFIISQSLVLPDICCWSLLTSKTLSLSLTIYLSVYTYIPTIYLSNHLSIFLYMFMFGIYQAIYLFRKTSLFNCSYRPACPSGLISFMHQNLFSDNFCAYIYLSIYSSRFVYIYQYLSIFINISLSI